MGRPAAGSAVSRVVVCRPAARGAHPHGHGGTRSGVFQFHLHSSGGHDKQLVAPSRPERAPLEPHVLRLQGGHSVPEHVQNLCVDWAKLGPSADVERLPGRHKHLLVGLGLEDVCHGVKEGGRA